MADRFQEAQQQLGRALHRSAASEDRELARQVREKGAQLARLQQGLVHMADMHALDNRAFDSPVHDFGQVLRELFDLLGPVHLLCVEHQIYVNDLRVRFDVHPERAEAFKNSLLRHNAGGITYNEVLPDAQVRALIGCLHSAPQPPRPRTALQNKLNSSGLHSLELHPVFRFRRSDEEHLDQDYADVYQASAGAVAEAVANLGANRLPNPLPVRRVIHDLIDVAHSQDAARMGWEADATLPAFARHTLMVTNLSVLIGQQAGLSDATLADLGVAAMLHDAGFCMTEGGFTVPYARHTRTGFAVLVRQRGFHEAKIHRLLAVLEHHRSYRDPGGRPSLFARIIHIADDYDILTRHRPHRGPIHAAPDAMQLLAAQGGKAYDPLLLKVFINALGPYPPGSFLKLADGHVVISLSGVRSKETFARPLCKLVRLPDGKPPGKEIMIDLAERGKVAGYLRPRTAKPRPGSP